MLPSYPKGSNEARLQPYAEAVGTLCQVWAELEGSVTELFATVAGMSSGTVTPVMLGCLDFRDKLAAIKVGAVAAKYDPALVELIHDAVNYIDNQLRCRRNRLVHDRWQPAFSDTGVWRIEMGSKLVRPHAGASPEIKGPAVTDEDVAEIWAVTAEITDHSQFLIDISVHVDMPEDFPLRPLLETPPSRRLLPPPQEKPPRKGKGKLGRKSPPPSSPG